MVADVGITATLIVKNEAAFLPRCLASITPWVSAIVVADTGSTDDTPAIAQAAGATVLHIPWTNDFAAARNRALDAVQTPWVLVIDADETLVADDGPLLWETVRHPQADAYNLRIISLADQADQLSEAYVTRLFRADPRIRWTGRVHEQIIPSLHAHGLSLGMVPIRLIHAGYLSPVVKARDKAARNQALLERELADRPHDPYVLWQWAQTVLQQGQVEPALSALRRAKRHLAPRHPLMPLLWVTEIKAHIVAGDWRRANTVTQAAIQDWPQYTDLYYLRGQIALQTNRIDEAVKAFHHAYNLGVPQGFLQTETGVATYKPLWGLVQCMQRQGDPRRLMAYLLLLLKTAPAFRPAWHALSVLDAGLPIAEVGRQLQVVLTPAQIVHTLRLWPDLNPWEAALAGWAARTLAQEGQEHGCTDSSAPSPASSAV